MSRTNAAALRGNVVRLTSGSPPVAMEPTAEEIRAWIESGESRHVTILCTPELAKVLMEYNEHNRPLSSENAAGLAQIMRDGNWINTGQPVIISNERWLNNGQHFLKAVIASGVTCEVDLRFGIPRSAFASTDSGKMRTAVDVLNMLGIPNATNTASTARLVLSYERGLPGAAKRRTSADAIVRAVERWPDLPHSVAQHCWVLGRGLNIAPTRTLGFFIGRVANDSVRAQFFTELAGSAEMPRRHVLRQLRDSIALEPGHGQDADTRVRALALCILAWEAWRAGDVHRPITWQPGLPYPKVSKLRL